MTDTLDNPHDPHAEHKPTKWEDASVPAGNAPPMSKLPLAISLIVWIGWVGFLAAIRFHML